MTIAGGAGQRATKKGGGFSEGETVLVFGDAGSGSRHGDGGTGPGGDECEPKRLYDHRRIKRFSLGRRLHRRDGDLKRQRGAGEHPPDRMDALGDVRMAVRQFG